MFWEISCGQFEMGLGVLAFRDLQETDPATHACSPKPCASTLLATGPLEIKEPRVGRIRAKNCNTYSMRTMVLLVTRVVVLIALTNTTCLRFFPTGP